MSILLPGPALVTLYLNLIAFFLVLGLMITSKRLNARKTYADKLFLLMGVGVMFYAAASSVQHILFGAVYLEYAGAAAIVRTFSMLSVLLLSFTWLLYVDFMIYGSRDYLIRTYWKHAIPLMLCSILLLLNIFTGIVFVPGENGRFADRPLYYLILLTETVFFLLSLLMAINHNRKKKQLHFFHASPMLVPFAIGMGVTAFTPFSAGPIGFAAGLTFIYFSLIERWRYEDGESGFYNRAWLKEVLGPAKEGKYSYDRVMLILTESHPDALADILRQLLPREAEVVRVSDRRFMLLLENGDKTLALMLEKMIRARAKTWGKEGMEEGLRIESFRREKEETGKAFTDRMIGLSEEEPSLRFGKEQTGWK